MKSYTVLVLRLRQIPYLYLCILILALFIYIAMRIYISRIGLSLNTIAQDEVAANCPGINIAARKLFAFVIGAIFCGLPVLFTEAIPVMWVRMISGFPSL